MKQSATFKNPAHHEYENFFLQYLCIWIGIFFVTVMTPVMAENLAETWVDQTSYSTHSFWDEHAQGWHWYQDPPANLDAKTMINVDPVKIMDALQKEIKEKLDRAVLNPTQENMRDYIALQNKISENASYFSNVWRATLLNYPELDYQLTHPTNAIGKAVYVGEQRESEDRAIREWAKKNGLFFFYRSSCPYCQRFSPILKNFVNQYGITVIPITTDGITLPDFPNSKADQGQSQRFHITVEPSLFTVNPYTHAIVPVAYGLMAEDELKQRIITIIQQPVANTATDKSD